MAETFKILIVEDDEINITLLKHFLSKYCQNCVVVGEARNSIEFIELFLSLKPDILLLDIDLGEEKNSLEILNEFDEIKSQIIIVSSHKDFALKAINKYHVVGYILKPFNITDLSNAMDIAKKNIIQSKALDKRKATNKGNIIGIPTSTSIDLVDIRDILYLEAEGKYTVFHMAKGESKVTSKNIGFYEKILPKHLFYRIHHKFIVNLKKVTTINRADGNYCVLNNGKSLSIATRRAEQLRKLLCVK